MIRDFPEFEVIQIINSDFISLFYTINLADLFAKFFEQCSWLQTINDWIE